MDLRLEGISHTYVSPSGEPRRVLDIPAWSLAPGDQVMLRGVSGSGKTTLFNICAGLMRPSSGNVYYGEQSLYALPEQVRDRFRAQHIGYIFQSHYLVSALTAQDNVMMPMMFAGKVPASKRRARAKDLLDTVGLADHAAYYPNQMSTGQRLRVGIARALANMPDVLLADEPTAALDTDAAETVMDYVQTACREANAVLVVASHDPALSARFPQVVHLKNGQLVVNEAEAETA